MTSPANRYFFHVTDGIQTLKDWVGCELPSAEAARRRALTKGFDILHNLKPVILVTDGADQQVVATEFLLDADQTENVDTITAAEEEQARLTVLRELAILDTPPSGGFDLLCRIARDMFDVPIVLVSLLDRDRQWFKASCGITLQSTPREIAFCNYTIKMPDGFLLVPDATKDARFCSNPLVTGEMGIRFYAGATLVVKGQAVGTLCILDYKPRSLVAAQIQQMKELAAVVVGQLELHEAKSAAEKEASERQSLLEMLETQSQELSRQQAIFRQTESLAHVGGWELDLKSKTVFWSDEIYRIHDLPVGKPVAFRRMLSFFHKAAQMKLRRAIASAIRRNVPFDLELRMTSHSKTEKFVRMLGSCEAHEGKATRIFGILADVTENRATTDKMWQLANHDILTGLPNRACFQRRLRQEIEQALLDGSKIVLALLDLDHLKDANDNFGHPAGDEVLRTFSQKLNSSIRPNDFASRIGGDEFAVILTGLATPTPAFSILESLQRRLQEPSDVSANTVSCSASIGVSIFPDHENDADALLKSADIALYSAKDVARGSIVLYAPEMGKQNDQRSRTAKIVKEALTDNRIFPYYQPKVSLASGRVVGFEALLRWQHPTQGVQLPGTISSVFENPELTIAIGKRILQRVVADVALWIGQGIEFGSVFVNATSSELRQPGYAITFLECLRNAGIPPRCVGLEVTETVFFGRSTDPIQSELKQLSDGGVAIHLDDFGTGYGSLTHLLQFPIDGLKIDRSFVSKMGSEPDAKAIVCAIIKLAKNLNLELVGEGIETVEQAKFLREEGCTIVQGFMFSKAVPEIDVPALVRKGPADFLSRFDTSINVGLR